MTSSIDHLRARIDQLDRTILQAVNERLRVVDELWEQKRAVGLERTDPGREAALRATLAASNDGPLSPEGLDRLVDAVLDLMRSELAAKRQARSG